MTTRKLKRVVIKEELYSLTNDTICAIILGQLIYWQERVEDFDAFIKEEKVRAENNGIDLSIDMQNGWMYKKASDLVEECMLNVSDVTIRRYLQNLINKKYIECRNNPKYKWDKTLQYRVNLSFIISEIKKLGYDGLSGYVLLNQKNEESKLQNEGSSEQNEAAIPKTTNRDYNINKEEIDKSISKKEQIDYDAIMSAWNEVAASMSKLSSVRNITEDRKQKIRTLFKKCNSNTEELIRLIKTLPYADDWVIGQQIGRDWAITFTWLISNVNGWYATSLEGGMHKKNRYMFDKIMRGEVSQEYQANGKKDDKLIINGVEYE